MTNILVNTNEDENDKTAWPVPTFFEKRRNLVGHAEKSRTKAKSTKVGISGKISWAF